MVNKYKIKTKINEIKSNSNNSKFKKRIQKDKNIETIAKSLSIKSEAELNLSIKRDFYCEHLVNIFVNLLFLVTQNDY